MRYLSYIALATLLAACSGPENSSETTVPTAEETADTAERAVISGPASIALYTFDCGRIEISDLDAFSTEGDYAGQSDVFSDTCFLIRHPDGDLLWDFGLPAELVQSGPQVNGIFTVSLDRRLVDQLKDIQVSSIDIEYVAVSHQHFDHIGQLSAFPDSTWLVHENEYNSMFPEEGGNEELASLAALNAQTFTGSKDVFGDGSVIILETPGHTPGHTSLQVNLPEAGPILLTGDLYHRAESRELKRVPRFNVDEVKTQDSMAAFEALASNLDARVIIQHEPLDTDTLPKPPAALK